MWQNCKPNAIWFHAASVGETRSIACLIDRLVAHQKHAPHFLITNSSKRALLVDIPIIDFGRAQRVAAPREYQVDQFITQTKPKLGIFVESELWPMLIIRSHAHGIPLVLVNGRMSDRSFRAWQRNVFTRKLCQYLLSKFQLIHAQTRADAARFKFLRGGSTKEEEILVGNLKSYPVLDDNVPAEIDTFLQTCEPGWAGISLHEGEAEVLIQAHRLANSSTFPLVLVPRHPRQGDKTVVQVEERVYQINAYNVVNRVCEWAARGSKLVFVGGSLAESKHHGGHNILEPIHCGCLAAHGKHMEAFQDFLNEQAEQLAQCHVQVNTAQEIAQLITTSAPTLPMRNSTKSLNNSNKELDRLVHRLANFI